MKNTRRDGTIFVNETDMAIEVDGFRTMSAAALNAVCERHRIPDYTIRGTGSSLKMLFSKLAVEKAALPVLSEGPDAGELEKQWGWTSERSVYSNQIKATLYKVPSPSMKYAQALLDVATVLCVEFTSDGWWVSVMDRDGVLMKRKRRQPELFMHRAGKRRVD